MLKVLEHFLKYNNKQEYDEVSKSQNINEFYFNDTKGTLNLEIFSDKMRVGNGIVPFDDSDQVATMTSHGILSIIRK